MWRSIYQNVLSSNIQELNDHFIEAFKIESYWAFPGKEVLYQLSHYLTGENLQCFKLLCGNLLEALEKESYRAQAFVPFYTNLNNLDKPQSHYVMKLKNGRS